MSVLDQWQEPTTILAIVSALLAIYNVILSRNKRQLKRLKEFVEGLWWHSEQYVDAVVLGPRSSGKTSLVELWTIPWTDITLLQSTSGWQVHEHPLHVFKTITQERDSHLGLMRQYRKRLNLRLHDYPGEERYVHDAIKKIQELQGGVVLLLVFRVGFHNGKIEFARENATYFSRATLEKASQHLGQLGKSVSRVIVVFNKADLLPPDWDHATSLSRLQAANEDALYQVRRVFEGMIDYAVVSALTNAGAIGLLGHVCKSTLAGKPEAAEFDQKWNSLSAAS